MRGSRICFAAAALALSASAPAAAQNDDGVFVDPDSPTAKQYSIPFESARRQADPDHGRLAPPGTASSGADAAALFGQGIASTSKASNGKDRNRKSKRSKGSDRPSSSGRESSGSNDPVKAAVSNPGAPSGGVGSALLIAAGGALVLLLGGLVGFVLRRRSS